MTRLALGLIEAIGLPAAIAAADTAVKSAHVDLLDYEITKGGGLVVVKFVGDVGAVRAAVDAGAAAAEAVGGLWAKHVIARPHEELEKLLRPKKGGGTTPPPPPQRDTGPGEEDETAPTEDQEEPEPAQLEEEFLDLAAAPLPGLPMEEPDREPKKNSSPGAMEPPVEGYLPAHKVTLPIEEGEGDGLEEPEEGDWPEEPEGDDEELCNLCGDPTCPRRKGEPRVKCIHFDD